jgi:hypothetical protein
VNLGVKEADYEWLTEELCKIANTHSQGRVISVLEGGYRIQGGVVSAFGRSVAAHLRAMFRESKETWSAEACKKELDHELKQRRLHKEALEAARAATIEAARAREEAAILAAQGAAAATGGDEEAAAAAAAAAIASEGAPSKRRRKEVDYGALNAQLEAEKAGTAPDVDDEGEPDEEDDEMAGDDEDDLEMLEDDEEEE